MSDWWLGGKGGRGKVVIIALVIRVIPFLIFVFMKAKDINTSIIDGYLRMFDNLNVVSKLDLISRLSLSIKLKEKQNVFNESFGAFESKRSADQIIAEVHASRNFKRKIEKF